MMLFKNTYVGFSGIFCFGVSIGSIDNFFGNSYVTKFSNEFKDGFFIASAIYSVGFLGPIVQGPLMSQLIHILGSVSFIYYESLHTTVMGLVACILIKLKVEVSKHETDSTNF